jgi:addiction module HigA family antidote
MTMKNPAHPGRIINEAIDDLGLTATEAVEMLHVSDSTLSRLLHGRSGVSEDMAERLSRIIGSTSGFWMCLQANYDRSQAPPTNEGM